MRCLSTTCASSGGLPTSPNNWNPASSRAASPPPTAARSTSGWKPARFALSLPGKLLRGALDGGIDVGVGDWVGVADGLIRAVLPRRSAIVRNAAGLTTTAQTLAANVDVAFVLSSLGPDLEPRRLERYLVTIWETGATPEIVLTKADRMEDPWELVAEVEAVAPGVPVHVVSALTGQGCDALRARIQPGATAVLLGSSGVGKSTLVNRWLGEEVMATSETREDDDEGRHTTTHPPAARAARRRARDRLARNPRAAAVGRRRRRTRRDVLRRRGAGRRVQVRRLLPRPRAGLRGARRGRESARYRRTGSRAGGSCSANCAR